MTVLQALAFPVPCPMFVSDTQGGLLGVNQALVRVLNLPPIGGAAPPHSDALFTPASRIFLQTHVWPLLIRDGRVREIYLQMRATDGAAVPVMVNADIIQTDHGEQCMWVCFEARDRSRFEAELVKARTEAESMATRLQAARADLERLNHELKHRADHAEQQNVALATLSRSDPLTGLGNRRAMEGAFEHWLDTAEADTPACLLMVDVDHFKSVNDRYGHDEGDRVLVMVARALSAGLRSSDVIVRHGGEEFAIWLPGSDTDSGIKTAQRLHEQVKALRSHDAAVTISIGIASTRAGASVPTLADLIHRADVAVYAAKRDGRNCTRVAG